MNEIVDMVSNFVLAVSNIVTARISDGYNYVNGTEIVQMLPENPRRSITFKLGGVKFTTTLDKIMSKGNTYLSTLVDPNSSFAKVSSDIIHVDWDPTHFSRVLDFYETGEYIIPRYCQYSLSSRREQLIHQADFFGIPVTEESIAQEVFTNNSKLQRYALVKCLAEVIYKKYTLEETDYELWVIRDDTKIYWSPFEYEEDYTDKCTSSASRLWFKLLREIPEKIFDDLMRTLRFMQIRLEILSDKTEFRDAPAIFIRVRHNALDVKKMIERFP
ncbi:unnamed protein product [Rhizophagus irregularis]|uniref:Potassium channel tetramerisation-type BTB domain-containing protein n=1 Tax=Rhizophagus irregularis TaxID=588596 RepID=A0A2N1M8Q8_9GLOM|nr:hypothetical protein RhiirC2_720845 [Rhizophagus irregularis]CAB4378744.1 unnamed protein product [Rhizophagus irregularis]CAB5370906.1 unnamed protein product [Rhizophagus irregularis]